MRVHFAMWGIMGLLIIFAGAMYRGQEDMLISKAQIDILIGLPISALGEIRVGKV